MRGGPQTHECAEEVIEESLALIPGCSQLGRLRSLPSLAEEGIEQSRARRLGRRAAHPTSVPSGVEYVHRPVLADLEALTEVSQT
jgi:hypothetical protein